MHAPIKAGVFCFPHICPYIPLMKRYILLLALLLASLLCPQSKMDINNLVEYGGLLYAPNDNKPYTGSVFSIYENGIEELNGKFRNGLKNGKWTSDVSFQGAGFFIFKNLTPSVFAKIMKNPNLITFISDDE